MRLFVALPMPDVLRSAVADAVDPLRKDGEAQVRWSDPAGWHITLAFLGEVDPARVAEVGVVMDEVVGACPRMRLSPGRAGRFGRHVLWLGVDDEPAGALARLGEAVQAALEVAGLPVERRPVHPHVTLARAGRDRVTDGQVAAIDARLPALDTTAWTATSVQLCSSRLGDGPARYTVEHETPLAG